MKKALFCLLLPALLAGCSKDSILPDIWSGNTGDPTDAGSATSQVEGPTTAEITSDEEDLVANTNFDLTVSVVFSPSGNASVSGTQGQTVTINGNQVTIDNRNAVDKNGKGYKIKYELSGSTSNGFFKVYSNNKQALVLNGVSITNPNGAAINNQGKKRCFVLVNGSNSLADGTSYTATPADEDELAFGEEAHTHKEDGLAGDGLDGKRRTAAGIAVHLGKHDAVDPHLGIKFLRHVHGILVAEADGRDSKSICSKRCIT